MTTQTTSMFMMLTVQAPKHVLGFEAELFCIARYCTLNKIYSQKKKENNNMCNISEVVNINTD